MKKFKEYKTKNSKYRELFERVNMSKSEFIAGMSSLYDIGDQEAIERAASIMAEIQVEKIIDEIFDTKAPSSAQQNREKLALEIRKLKIDPQDRVNLAQGMLTGEAYDIEKALRAKGAYSLSKIVNTKFKGAKELLRWLVEWDASPDSGKRGKASTELFFIIAGKNGRTPDKGDSIVNGIAVEIKSYKSGYQYEFTVNGKQGNGKEPRDQWIAEAKKLYQSKRIMKKWYPGTPFGFVIAPVPMSGPKSTATVNPDAKPGKNTDHLAATMSAFCMELQNAGMPWQSINAWIVKTTNKILLSGGIQALSWDGKTFDAHAFLAMWNSCALDYYRKKEGFDVITLVNKSNLSTVTIADGKQMFSMRKQMSPASISNKDMPGQNSSVAAGSFKL